MSAEARVRVAPHWRPAEMHDAQPSRRGSAQCKPLAAALGVLWVAKFTARSKFATVPVVINTLSPNPGSAPRLAHIQHIRVVIKLCGAQTSQEIVGPRYSLPKQSVVVRSGWPALEELTRAP